MVLLGGLALILLLGAAGLSVWAAVMGLPAHWITGLTTWVGRTVLGVLAFTFVGVGMWLALSLSGAAASRRAARRPGPKGEIVIAPQALRELATALLTHDLGLSGFRIAIRSANDGVYLRVALRLPSGEEVPQLAERVQELLGREIQNKTGIPVHEITLSIRGTTPRSEKRTDLPDSGPTA